MSVTLPDEYVFVKGHGETIRLRKNIEDDEFLIMARNANNLLGQVNRRVIFESTGSVTDTTATYRDLYEGTATIADHRDGTDLEVVVTGYDVDVRITLYNAAKSVALSGPTVYSLAGSSGLRVTNSSTLAAPGATDVVILVEFKTNAAVGAISSVRIIEGRMVAGDLPGVASGWQKMDETAIVPDALTATLVAYKTVDNYLEVISSRAHNYSFGYDVAAPPLFHGWMQHTDDTRRMVWPFIVSRRAWDALANIRLRVSGHGQIVTIGLCKGPLISGGIVPANAVEKTLAAGGGIVTHDLSTVDDLDLSGVDGAYLVFLTCRSEDDATGEELKDASGLDADLSFGQHSVAVEASSEWSGTPLDDEVLPYWLEFVTGSTAATAEWDNNDRTNPLPEPKMALRFAERGANPDLIYFHPPFEEGNPTVDASPKTDWVRRHEIGYAKIYGVEWQISGTKAVADFGTTFEPGLRGSALTAKRLQTFGDRIFSELGRVHRMGPRPSNSLTDNDTGGLGGLASNLHGWQPYIGSSSFFSLAGCVVGSDDRLKVNSGGAAQIRNRYIVRAMVALVTYARSPVDIDIDFRLRLISLPDGTGSVAPEVLGTAAGGGRIDDVRLSSHIFSRFKPLDDELGYLLGWFPVQGDGFGSNTTDREPGMRAGQGFFPEHLWPKLRFRVLTLELQDDPSLGTGERDLILQFAYPSSTVGGEALDGHKPLVKLITWEVRSVTVDLASFEEMAGLQS